MKDNALLHFDRNTKWWQKVIKSITPAFLIGIGQYGLLVSDYALPAMFLFAFGLYMICVEGLWLFTGKCGYVFYDFSVPDLLVYSLLGNMVFGYLFGRLLGIMNPKIYALACEKVAGWDWSFSFFIKSVLCGMIMYFCVDAYRKTKTPYAIILGIPLFIFCGFQHCIANVITMGVAGNFNSALILCVLGNWTGSLIVGLFTQNRGDL